MAEFLVQEEQDYARHIADITTLLKPQDPDSADMEEADSIWMEKEVERLRKKLRLEANPPIKPFEISINGLMSFRQAKLQTIYDGIRNIVIPVEMLSVMNGDEIIAIYYGTSVLKKGDKRLQENLKFSDLVSKINNEAYPSIGRMAKLWKRRFPNGSGDEVKRLTLGDAVKREFVESYSKLQVIVPETPDAGVKIYGHLQKRQIEVLLQ